MGEERETERGEHVTKIEDDILHASLGRGIGYP